MSFTNDKKIDELTTLLNDQREYWESSALCFTETWLHGEPDSAVELTGFLMVRADRDRTLSRKKSAEDFGEDVEGLADCITLYIRTCEESIVPTKKVRCFPNNKPWINKNIKALLNRKKRAFMAKDREGVKSVQKELKGELRRAKKGYKEKIEGKLEDNSTREVWDGLKRITGQKQAGFAKVRWTESRNAGSNTAYTQNYTEEVEYLNHCDILIGHERDEDNSEESLTTLHSGRHEYAFSLELPQTPLATSFEGKHGSVRYWVKAELHRPWLLPMKVKKEFTVFEHIDINTPLLLSPQAGTKDKTLCCWFCTSGPISLSAKIERKGYTPGESIQIFAEIENCSSRMVVPKAAIYQTQTFYAKGKMKEVKQLVANLRGESLSSGKTETWSGKMLKIPPVSPSILDCSIIRVEYSLMVYVDIPGAMNLSLNLPLVIGTIPLHPFGSRTSSVSSQCSMTMNWLGMALPERPEAPPSYAEIVTEDHRRSGQELAATRDEFEGPLFAYIQEFRFQPPPLYSEIDPNPDQVVGAEERRPDTCPSR
ncbi:hypothetical protein AAFF_G00024420 [Aldrovandia affinis]|uniref:Arrestin domain-containing protein 3 n=1 Tax=Aldrovandia affinis TaxID=143900 RepID=A0AAD7T5R1_9TELE|nr:hypothetical protein AAFF_G00024420 [Aldrovandia affinis]